MKLQCVFLTNCNVIFWMNFIVSQFVQLHITADNSLALHLLGKLERATQQLLSESGIER